VSVDRLLNQIGHWEPGRWSAPASTGGTRADSVYAVIQRLADLAADAERRPRRTVPRSSDLILPDQLRVMADDLLAGADPDTLAKATTDIDALRHFL